MTRCMLVVGYNNARIYDIAKLRTICATEHDLKLVLVTEQIQPQDNSAADIVLACDLGKGKLESSRNYVVHELAQLGFTPVGVLPFSDRGGMLGAVLAAHFSLPGAELEDAAAGLDKCILRQREQKIQNCPAEYRQIFSKQVHNLDDFRETVVSLGGQAFAKPTSEGNSRGCRAIHDSDECDAVWASLAPYCNGGVIVEDLIKNTCEYSWDFVSGFQWITEKRTTEGKFRAEYQQIVPAPLSAEAYTRITAAGQYIRKLISEKNGAYHNEVFLHDDGTTSAVETNMRPGGMHIWDLAARSFAGFNPWREWVWWALTGHGMPTMLKPLCYSGIRMIRAPRHGVLKMLPDIEAVAARLGIVVDETLFSKRIGESVTDQPKDNTDFIGEIMMHAHDCDVLREQLSNLADEIEKCVEVAAHSKTQDRVQETFYGERTRSIACA